MKNCSFWTENRNFWWKTCVSEQNTAIFDEKHAFLNKIQLISVCRTCFLNRKIQLLFGVRASLTEILKFCSETCVSEQNTTIYDEKRAFLNRIQQLLTKNARFCSPPSEGPGEVLVSAPLLRRGRGETFVFTPLLRRGRGRLRFFCRKQRFPPKNQSWCSEFADFAR